MDGQKTIIVCGNFRGGTTAVAQLLDRLGIPLGEKMDPNNNCEDLEFQQVLLRETLDRAELDRLVRERNARHAIWGFKFPGAHLHMPAMLESFRNPQVIFVFRDPYAVADSEQRRTGQSLSRMMERTVEYNLHMTRLLQSLSCPTHPVSFEQLLVRPAAVIDRLLTFLSIRLSWWERRRLLRSVRLKKDSSSYGYAKG
ncbi:MAG TPA: hypothetical protein DDY20_09240 [Desulfobulbaceae bacterium]|nr:hypothetical protein [Desulfobulbaceae bacterium]